MIHKDTSIKKKAYLKAALVFFAGWLFIAYVIVNNLLELGGLPGLMNVIQSGDYSDLILLVFSIFLLAYFFKNLYLFFSSKDSES